MNEQEKVTYARMNKTDGHLDLIRVEDVKRGNVLRTVGKDGSQSAFSDHVILDVYKVNKYGVPLHEPILQEVTDTHVRLSRPYAYVSLIETACPTILTGVETYSVNLSTLLREDSRYRVVCQSTGQPATMISYTSPPVA